MTRYDQSRWADREFSDGYADKAEDIIQERRRLIGVLLSYYAKFYGDKESVRALDLGCGDGTVMRELAVRFGNVTPTLLDGSDAMLDRAKERLGEVEGARFVRSSFEELLEGGTSIDGGYDLIFSSLAIHHLYAEQKAALYKLVFDSLASGGSFVNIDVVLAPSERLESWYLDNWREYITARAKAARVDEFTDFTLQYKENEDNKPDTLEVQLGMLRDAGFADVDCHYKDGIFTVFGGRKPGA